MDISTSLEHWRNDMAVRSTASGGNAASAPTGDEDSMGRVVRAV
jgi:hypothetical protein